MFGTGSNYLTGFLYCASFPCLLSTLAGVYSVITAVPLGYHLFHYVVNGTRIISLRHPITTDGKHNWRIIRGPPKLSRHTEAKKQARETFVDKLLAGIDAIFAPEDKSTREKDSIQRLRRKQKRPSSPQSVIQSGGDDVFNAFDVEQGHKEKPFNDRSIIPKTSRNHSTSFYVIFLVSSAAAIYILAHFTLLKGWLLPR